MDSAPWSVIGTSVSVGQSPAGMLHAAKADYDVISLPVTVSDPVTGSLVVVNNRHVTCKSGVYGFEPWGVVKGRYKIVQNSEVLGKALDVVHQCGDGASLTSLGILNGGRKFFAVIDMGNTVVDVGNTTDTIRRYVVLFTSHDGSSPIEYVSTDVLVGCSTVVRLPMAPTLTSRHTTNVESGSVSETGDVVDMNRAWSTKGLPYAVARLEKVQVPNDSLVISSVIEQLWPSDAANTKNKLVNRETVVRSIRRNMKVFSESGRGWNGWSFLNSINAYLDHERGVSVAKLAQDSLEVSNSVHRAKLKAYESLLAVSH